MNKKLAIYCSETLRKMIVYHDYKGDVLLEINSDLKKLLSISSINLYKISKYHPENDKEFFLKLRDLLFDNYIKTEIVRQWLILFISNHAISFDDIIYAADNFNSKTLEINIRINKKIELTELRKNKIINSTLIKSRDETLHDNYYEYFIVNIVNKKNQQIDSPKIFTRAHIDDIEKTDSAGIQVSETELMNTIFDYYIINKQKEKT